MDTHDGHIDTHDGHIHTYTVHNTYDGSYRHTRYDYRHTRWTYRHTRWHIDTHVYNIKDTPGSHRTHQNGNIVTHYGHIDTHV